MIKLFNTKTNRLEVFKSIEENKVSLYVCGPTVYNHSHIGNARPIVVFDTLKKLLEAVGYEVTYVSNYTDIDDKIIDQAIDKNLSEAEVSEHYIAAYEDIRRLYHAVSPDALPRVTQTMEGIISFIQDLIDDGAAYEKDGNVYFNVDTVKTYGQLSHQNLDELRVGARIEENTEKNSPLDFVVWKKTDKGISWDSPWSKGRPGWHTECVVMIHQEFQKNKIDIHGGGQDLKFPHHENENAQNCALHHESLANYWVHNAMLDIDHQKMSKSLGNVVWAKDFVKELGSNVARWVLIQNHYRQNISITDAVIKQSQTEVEKLESALKNAALMLQLRDSWQEVIHTDSLNEFIEALSDDLNTPNAIMVLFERVKQLNQLVRQRDLDLSEVSALVNALVKMAYMLGIEFDLLVDQENLEKVRAWQTAKADKDFALADKLRAELVDSGVL